jgi:hypothetical protein
VRVKSRWSKTDKPKTAEDTGGALAFIAWRIAGQGVLNLENEGFQTDTQRQRLDVITEFVAFLIHVTDRLCYGPISDEERAALINAFALRTADTYAGNLHDLGEPTEGRRDYIATLNQRMDDYAGMSFRDGEPAFNLLAGFGERVAAKMGPKDNRWIQDQVMEIEAPKAVKTLKRALRDLVPATAEES